MAGWRPAFSFPTTSRWAGFWPLLWQRFWSLHEAIAVGAVRASGVIGIWKDRRQTDFFRRLQVGTYYPAWLRVSLNRRWFLRGEHLRAKNGRGIHVGCRKEAGFALTRRLGPTEA